MILVDSSIWIDHLRSGDQTLVELLNASRVLMHPFVLGELACGNLRNRSEILSLLKGLPQAAVASHAEVMFFTERQSLMGKGVGYVDAHLLAAVALDGPTQLWTRDKRLRKLAASLEVAYLRD